MYILTWWLKFTKKICIYAYFYNFYAFEDYCHNVSTKEKEKKKEKKEKEKREATAI